MSTVKKNLKVDVSVVVPVRDEEDSVRALVDGLLKQTLAPKEIVITDGGSTDATVSIIEEFITAGAPIRLFRENDSMPGRARNVGAKHAACEWIAFIDAGIRPSNDWLASLTEKVGDSSGADVVYGSYEPVIDSFFKECAAIAYVPPTTDTAEGPVRPYFIASALMRRRAWEAVGGFPEHLRSAEDLLFMNDVERAGFRIVRAPRALVHWTIRPGLWTTFKRFVEYSRNNIRAGFWREWQATIFLRYAVLATFCLPAFLLGWRWLLVPFICWLLMMMARGVQALSRNLAGYPASLGRNIARLCLLVPIITVIDAAAIIGSIKWLVIDAFWAHPRESTS